MAPRRKRISHCRLAIIARSRLSTSVSRKSSLRSFTETQRESSSSNKRASKYGSSIRNGFQRGIYTSTKTGRTERFDSSYELRRFKALDESSIVQDWGRPKFRIRYKWKTAKRGRKLYHPDILVKYHDGRIFLEEVKGYLPNKRMFIRKNQMAKVFCKARGWEYRVVWEKDLETLF